MTELKKKIRLVGVDLDGTILDKEKRVSERTREVIKRAGEQGILVVPVTGRPYMGLPEAVQNLPGLRYAITTNGSVITDVLNNKKLYAKCIKTELAIQLYHICENVNPIREVFLNDAGYSEKVMHDRMFARYKGTAFESYFRQSKFEVENVDEFLQGFTGQDVVETVGFYYGKLASRQEDEIKSCDEIVREVREMGGLNAIRTAPTVVEVVHADVNKGAGLLKLGELLGIEKDEIMAIGDSGNDIDMLEQAGFSVAMGNAPDFIKKIAGRSTDDCDHDGAAKAIEMYCLN